MTVIAWDGKTLAADKRCCYGSMINTTTKVWRVRHEGLGEDVLIGGAGDYGSVQAMREWIRLGADPTTFPEIQRTDQWAPMIVITKRGALMFERTPHPIEYDAGCPVTVGSGREFARAALHLGCDARHAVAVACALDSGCGNGIDTLTLEVEPARTKTSLEQAYERAFPPRMNDSCATEPLV